ncbi:MAG: diguanylate cyclase [Clostridiales bacterium]|nr:diguanylate cyclase [Clostridiales bacterium]
MGLLKAEKILILIPMALVAFVGLYALFRCRSDKKGFFILAAFAAFLHILGHLLNLMSSSMGAALTAIRISGFGSGLVVLVYVFFISEYCDIKINGALKMFLSAITALYISGIWTTDVTGFYYATLQLDPCNSNHLIYTRGPLFHFFTLYLVVYFVISLVIIIRKIVFSHGDFKKTLILIMASFLFLFFAKLLENIVAFGNFSSRPVYLTPYAYGISAVILYFSIKKYDMLDESPLPSMQAMNTISQAMILLDEKLNYVSSNGAAKALFPWLRDYKTGEAIFYSPHWPSELSRIAFLNGEFSVDFKDAASYYHATAHPFSSELSRKKHWTVMIQDVTDTEHFVKQLEEAAYTDTLTGLYNRRHFAEIATPFIDRAKRSGIPYYIMIADLDFFKKINDEHGHLAGDAVLRHTAAIMKSTVRSYDIVSRWGGEEFIFLITDSNMEDVTALAERIRYAIEHTECEYEGKKLHTTVSFGIAQSGDEDVDMTELILRADRALYISKQEGRNRVTLWSADER